MSLIMFNRCVNKANVLLLINQGRLFNCKNHIGPINSLLPRLSALSFQQQDVKSLSLSTTRATANEQGHSHVKMWVLEKALAASMLGIIPAAFVFPHPSLDYLLSLALITHVHWGMEAIIIDYIRSSVFGSTIPKVSLAGLYFFSAFALGGLFYFNYSDVGLVKAIKMFWAL